MYLYCKNNITWSSFSLPSQLPALARNVSPRFLPISPNGEGIAMYVIYIFLSSQKRGATSFRKDQWKLSRVFACFLIDGLRFLIASLSTCSTLNPEIWFGRGSGNYHLVCLREQKLKFFHGFARLFLFAFFHVSSSFLFVFDHFHMFAFYVPKSHEV